MAGSMPRGNFNAEKSPPTRLGLEIEEKGNSGVLDSFVDPRLRLGLIQDRSWTAFRRLPWALVV
jgi:hypothetical protein